MSQFNSIDSGIHCLVMLAKFHGVAAEAEQLHYQFGRGDAALDDIAMLRAAKSLKLKARKIKVAVDQLTDLPLPAIARQVDGHYFILNSSVESFD